MRTLLTFLLLTAFSATRAQSPGIYSPCQEMPALMQIYRADYQSLTRFYAPAPPARLEQLYHSYLEQLQKINFDGLSQECKVDYILFKRDLNEKLRLSAIETQESAAIRPWFPFADTIYALQRLRRRGIRPDAQQVAKNWDAITRHIYTLLPRLRQDTSLSVPSIRAAMGTANYLQQCLTGIYSFYNGYDPLFSWWVPKTYTALSRALTEYSDTFRKKQKIDASGIAARKPIGRDEIVRLLKYEMIDYTPEELVDMANKEFAWCDQEMVKASQEYGFGNDWKAALEKVKDTYVPAGEQPEAILQLYNESVDFLKQHDLVTIPPLAEEVWGMYMMSPERQRTNAFFTGGWDITISYPTNTMEEDDRLMSMRGNNPHFSRATVHHELIAGHNLEFFSNARHRTYRDYDTPFWVEGWSLYWELLLYDMHFARTPEDRIGMLFWRMHRCARIIFSFNYHMGKWTPQQCIDFLVDRVGHERANAESEIRGPLSGNSNPLYQVGYLTGGFEFYALKKELVDNGKMTCKQFNDAVMQLNCMPVEMIRAILTNQSLTKDYTPGWKFLTTK